MHSLRFDLTASAFQAGRGVCYYANSLIAFGSGRPKSAIYLDDDHSGSPAAKYQKMAED